MAAGRLPVLFEDVAIAATRIRGGVTRTALTHSHWLSQLCGCELGVPVSVLMPTVAPMAKRSKCATFGAHIVVHGDTIGDAKLHAETTAPFCDMTYVNGYDDVPIIAGAGTLGLELIEQLPEGDHFDYVMVPCGGAGLLAGVSLAIKTLRPQTRVVGVEPRNCASFSHALAVGHPDPVETTSTLADGLAVPTVGANAFEVARAHADDVCIVDEADVALAVLRLLENEKVTIEGGGATGLAAILPGGPYHDQVRGAKVAVPLCGGNIDVTTLGRVIDRGMAADGRLVRFVAESAVDRVQIKFILECTGADHSRAVREAMIDAGVTILVWGREVYTRGDPNTTQLLETTTGGPAEPAPFE
ncbi:L-threonine ammonia-lyase [Aureococcus anophagefferens]|nr:L-threonine ammonia-lyase [Aureococcus anophagefferens]